MSNSKLKRLFLSLPHVLRHSAFGATRDNRYRYGASVEDALHKLEYDLYYVKNMIRTPEE
jgi:hypothetical protein